METPDYENARTPDTVDSIFLTHPTGAAKFHHLQNFDDLDSENPKWRILNHRIHVTTGAYFVGVANIIIFSLLLIKSAYRITLGPIDEETIIFQRNWVSSLIAVIVCVAAIISPLLMFIAIRKENPKLIIPQLAVEVLIAFFAICYIVLNVIWRKWVLLGIFVIVLVVELIFLYIVNKCYEYLQNVDKQCNPENYDLNKPRTSLEVAMFSKDSFRGFR